LALKKKLKCFFGGGWKASYEQTERATSKMSVSNKPKRVIIVEEDTPTPPPPTPTSFPPSQVLMGQLKEKTSQRNDAIQRNDILSKKNSSLMDIQFETFGRLVKYEPSVFEEVFDYAEKNNAMMKIESSLIGEYSTIGDYKTKSGKVFKAHFTKYGHYYRKCSSPDETPISYKGYFPFKKYKELMRINKTRGSYTCLEDFIEFI
jgi:hypothetical protein